MRGRRGREKVVKSNFSKEKSTCLLFITFPFTWPRFNQWRSGTLYPLNREGSKLFPEQQPSLKGRLEGVRKGRILLPRSYPSHPLSSSLWGRNCLKETDSGAFTKRVKNSGEKRETWRLNQNLEWRKDELGFEGKETPGRKGRKHEPVSADEKGEGNRCMEASWLGRKGAPLGYNEKEGKLGFRQSVSESDLSFLPSSCFPFAPLFPFSLSSSLSLFFPFSLFPHCPLFPSLWLSQALIASLVSMHSLTHTNLSSPFLFTVSLTVYCFTHTEINHFSSLHHLY